MRPVFPVHIKLMISGKTQSVSGIENLMEAQWASSRALKAFSEGAQATSAGRPFQLLMIWVAKGDTSDPCGRGELVQFQRMTSCTVGQRDECNHEQRLHIY